MAEKRSPKIDKELEFFEKLRLGPQAPAEGGAKLKVKHLSRRTLSVIKLICGICLLPFVYSVTVSFLGGLDLLDKILQDSFRQGVITFLIIYLFAYEPAILYKRGQRILEITFKFFAPLVRVAPYLLPIYAVIIFLGYLLFSPLFKDKDFAGLLLFLLGISFSLHLVFTAKSIRAKQGDFLKSNYVFGFSFIYILNVILLAFFLNIIFKEFPFVSFFNNSFRAGAGVFEAVFRQLFL